MSMEIRPLSEWNLEEMVQLWNEGFSDYYSNMTMDAAGFDARMKRDALSAEMSLVAWVDGVPAGFVLSGIREIGGKRVGWNGGTAVVPEFRGQGVGRRLMETVLDLYRTHGVDTATLEAIAVNERAISLYRNLGYQVVDKIKIYRSEQNLPRLGGMRRASYTVRKEAAQAVARLPFYRWDAPWQSQWFCAPGGAALIAEDKSGKALGYALGTKSRNEAGEWSRMVVSDLVVRPDHPDREEVALLLLEEAFAPVNTPALRTVLHVSGKIPWLADLLERAGFTVFVEQVQMELKL